MADFNPDDLAKVLVERGGYNSVDAANAARGSRAGELAREFKISSFNFGGGGNFGSTLDSARSQFQQANAPVIGNLQAQAGLLPQQTQLSQQRIEGQKTNLQQRYDTLISGIKGQGEAQVNRQTVTTRNELGRRGIPLSSGVADQEITNALNPINASVANQFQQVGLAQQGDINELDYQMNALPLQEQQNRLAIEQAIAQLQASGDQNAVQLAMQMQQQQQQQDQFSQQFGFQQQQQAFENQLATQRSGLENQLLKNQISKANTPAAAPAANPFSSLLLQYLNPQPQTPEPKPLYTPNPKFQK